MKAALEDVVRIAEALREGQDRRPPSLTKYRHANDPNFLYYRFLYEIAITFGPFEALEIGTFVGVSAAHLAAHPGNRVVTIDSNPDAKKQADALETPNVTAVTSDSIAYGKALPPGREFDILFIDGNHTLNQAYGEYDLYRPRIRTGGLILFDDIELPMATREMHIFWDYCVVDPKVSLPWLHFTGFGVAQVSEPRRPLPPWAQAVAEIKRRAREPGIP